MKDNFSKYGEIYDFFYFDKNYMKEARHLNELIKKNLEIGTANLSILDVGCGTGGYAQHLNKYYKITGIDLSKEMIKIANNKNLKNCKFYEGDGTQYISSKKYDIVISMFHVVNYQITKIQFNKFIRNAFLNLKPGGIFIFDFWNSPATLIDPPESKIKIVSSVNELLLRHTLPRRFSKNRIDIKFDFYRIKYGHNKIKSFSETHKIRTLDKSAITQLATKNFKLVELNKAFYFKPLTAKDWHGLAVFKKLS